MGKWKTACMAAPSVLSSAVRRLGSLALAERRLGSLALAERRLGGLALAERRLFSLVLAVLLLAVPVLLGGCGGQRGGWRGRKRKTGCRRIRTRDSRRNFRAFHGPAGRRPYG